MKELTFGELKAALLCCTVYRNCSGCPLYNETDSEPDEDCHHKLLAAALNCINTMERDLAEMATRAGQWEQQCTMRENELFELRESLDNRGMKND